MAAFAGTTGTGYASAARSTSSTQSRSLSSATASVSRTSQNQASSSGTRSGSGGSSNFGGGGGGGRDSGQAANRPSGSGGSSNFGGGGGGGRDSGQAANRPSNSGFTNTGGGGGGRDSGQAANRPSTPMAGQGSSFSSSSAATNFNNRVTGQVLAGNNPSGSLKPFEAPTQGGVAGIARSSTQQPAFGGFDTNIGGITSLGPRVMNPIYSNAPTAGLGSYIKDPSRVPTYQDLGVAGVPGGIPQRYTTGAPLNPYEGMTRPAARTRGVTAEDLQGAFDYSAGANSPFADPGVAGYDPNNPILSTNPIRPPTLGPNERYGGRVLTENERVAQALYGDATLGDVPMPEGRAYNTGVPTFSGQTPTAPVVSVSNLAVPENIYASGVAFNNPDARYAAFNGVAPINSTREMATAFVPDRAGNVSETVAGQNTTTAYPAANPPRTPFEQARIDAMREQYGLYKNTAYWNEIAEPPPLPNQTVAMGQYPANPGITSNNTVSDIMARYQNPTPVSNIVSVSNAANPANDASVLFNNPDARYQVFNNVEPIRPYDDRPSVPQPTGQTTLTVADILSNYDRPVPRPIAGQAYGPFIDQYSLNDADTLAQQVAEFGFPGEPTPYAAATAQAEAIRRQMAEQQVAENTPRLEIQIPGNEYLDLDNVDPDAPPTKQYVPPTVPGQENDRGPGYFTDEQRIAYLNALGIGQGSNNGGQNYVPPQYVVPPTTPPVEPPPPVTPPPPAIDWFNMNRINPPYQTVVPTPLLQTAPVSTGVGSLLPRIVVVDPFA